MCPYRGNRCEWFPYGGNIADVWAPNMDDIADVCALFAPAFYVNIQMF